LKFLNLLKLAERSLPEVTAFRGFRLFNVFVFRVVVGMTMEYLLTVGIKLMPGAIRGIKGAGNSSGRIRGRPYGWHSFFAVGKRSALQLTIY
jgi:hypothetical protein